VLHLLGETEALKYETVDEAMTSFSSGKEILKLIEARAEIMKDAWLNSTGHIRPGMKTGLPLNEAYAKVAETDAQIKIILHP
jgi:hypothetical protein